jgi:hypothetical protein
MIGRSCPQRKRPWIAARVCGVERLELLFFIYCCFCVYFVRRSDFIRDLSYVLRLFSFWRRI